MAASSELPYEVQRCEARRRAVIKTKSGLSPIQYLTPNFLSHFPVVMEPKESEEHPVPTWNKVGGLLAIEREIFVSNFDVYTDTTAFHPLTLVACKPEYEPDYNEFDEAIPDMRARVEKEMEKEREAQHQERIHLMQGGEGKTSEMDTTPAPGPAAIAGTQLHVIPPDGATMEDFSKSGQVVTDLTESADDPASVGNAGGQASQPQGAAGGSKDGARISDEELTSRLLLFKCLNRMNYDQNILEDAYYKCVEIVRGVVQEVSADLDAMENAYVAAVMKALGEWQDSGAKALQAMHTASAKEWDGLHAELVETTVKFRNACLEAETTEANGLAEVARKIASGARKDPATDILERSIQSTRRVIDGAADTFCKALKDSWLGSVSSQQLPTLVASSYGVRMTFCTAVWRLISDESVWPSRLRSILDEHPCFMRSSGASSTRRGSGDSCLTCAELLYVADIYNCQSPGVFIRVWVWSVYTCRYTDGSQENLRGFTPVHLLTDGASCHHSTLAPPTPGLRGFAGYPTRYCWV